MLKYFRHFVLIIIVVCYMGTFSTIALASDGYDFENFTEADSP